ncbi:putative signal transducing protein [Marinimicrobium alkaliphilum]|uniref:putative signal transducing protein n=1 Tax=Marinimicrobium alkaliphilum TaxID=2202654 RepID=UPI000DB9B352|nr:DUF2007 domain-containing protein [Marinimicrobium alkaliphilum]
MPIPVFEASSTLEAQMIINLLDQHDIAAEMDGEYLQGGVGELQAMGIVRVLVNERDYGAAQRVVEDWNAQQPESEPGANTALRSSSWNVGSLILGMLLGSALMLIFCHAT